MAEIPLQLVGARGEPLGQLRGGAHALIAAGEELAREQNLSKRTALPRALSEQIRAAGFTADASATTDAVSALEAVRRGQRTEPIRITVRELVPAAHSSTAPSAEKPQPNRGPMPAAQNSSQLRRFFEPEREYPDPAAKAWFDRLVGLDEQKEELLLELELLLYPERLAAWSKQHHGRTLTICGLQEQRVPLILLEGDVGTGKTALAETVGDPLARRADGRTRVHMLKVNTQIRGTGLVGEMTDLIVQAFEQAEAHARTLAGSPLLLLLDEADAVAATRDGTQMHHEDRAGTDTLLQRLDHLRVAGLRVGVIFITNRPNALDPAIRRRAALALRFERPNDTMREAIIRGAVPELRITDDQMAELVRLTAARSKGGVPFTASDLTDRLLPGALRRAYKENRPLVAVDLLTTARGLDPTPALVA